MPKLNFYDADAVKAFALDILVENQELRKENADISRRSDSWFRSYQREKEKVASAESATAAAITILEQYQDGRKDSPTADPGVDAIIASVLSVLRGGAAG